MRPCCELPANANNPPIPAHWLPILCPIAPQNPRSAPLMPPELCRPRPGERRRWEEVPELMRCWPVWSAYPPIPISIWQRYGISRRVRRGLFCGRRGSDFVWCLLVHATFMAGIGAVLGDLVGELPTCVASTAVALVAWKQTRSGLASTMPEVD